jgi:threonine/homoserine/homoserine lactone efflux protein
MLAAQFSPGPDMLLLLKAAVNHPLKAGLLTVLGIVCGLAVHCMLGVLGLSVLLQTNPWTFKVLLVLGAFYLGWLGCKLLLSLRQRPAVADDLAEGKDISSTAAFMQGLVTNLTNVKAFLFLTSFLTAGLRDDPSSQRRWLLVAIILGQALVFWSLFLWLLKRPSLLAAYQRLERPLNAMFGILLLCLSVQMLLALRENII